MFVVLLRFTEGGERASAYAAEHVAWIRQGVADGVFLVAGSLQPCLGGAILAHGVTAEALKARVDEDPFVVEGVVSVEILEVTPAMADARVQFLVEA